MYYEMTINLEIFNNPCLEKIKFGSCAYNPKFTRYPCSFSAYYIIGSNLYFSRNNFVFIHFSTNLTIFRLKMGNERLDNVAPTLYNTKPRERPKTKEEM